jgi:hypothetical protein
MTCIETPDECLLGATVPLTKEGLNEHARKISIRWFPTSTLVLFGCWASTYFDRAAGTERRGERRRLDADAHRVSARRGGSNPVGRATYLVPHLSGSIGTYDGIRVVPSKVTVTD